MQFRATPRGRLKPYRFISESEDKPQDFHPYAKSSRSCRKRTASVLNNNETNYDEMSEDGKEKKRSGG
jgi:hypothetical protein